MISWACNEKRMFAMQSVEVTKSDSVLKFSLGDICESSNDRVFVVVEIEARPWARKYVKFAQNRTHTLKFAARFTNFNFADSISEPLRAFGRTRSST